MEVVATSEAVRELLLNAVFSQDLCPVHRDELIVRGARELLEELTAKVDADLTTGGLSGIEEHTKEMVRETVVRNFHEGVNGALGELLIDERIGVEK